MVGSDDSDTDFFDIVTGVVQRDAIALYLWTSIDLIFQKWFQIEIKFKKNRKQTISCRNYDRRKLCSWSSVSLRHTCPSQIHAAWSKQSEAEFMGVHIQYKAFEISRQVHISR